VEVKYGFTYWAHALSHSLLVHLFQICSTTFNIEVMEFGLKQQTDSE